MRHSKSSHLGTNAYPANDLIIMVSEEKLEFKTMTCSPVGGRIGMYAKSGSLLCRMATAVLALPQDQVS